VSDVIEISSESFSESETLLQAEQVPCAVSSSGLSSSFTDTIEKISKLRIGEADVRGIDCQDDNNNALSTLSLMNDSRTVN
jgi:hypothetical protein